MLQVKPILPVTGWRAFPGYDIPAMFNNGHIYHYVVDTMPRINIHGKLVTVAELECNEDGDFWVSIVVISKHTGMQRDIHVLLFLCSFVRKHLSRLASPARAVVL